MLLNEIIYIAYTYPYCIFQDEAGELYYNCNPEGTYEPGEPTERKKVTPVLELGKTEQSIICQALI